MNSAFLREVSCFLFDMDGTLYLGERVLPGAREMLDLLAGKHVPFFLFTNNSSRSKEDYLHKLEKLGLPVNADQVVTSGDATIHYLQRKYHDCAVYLVGTPSLEREFQAHGVRLSEQSPDVVVLGFDTTVTYHKLETLCHHVQRGLPFIATHPDINCPTEQGFIPDIGAMLALVEASTGRRPDIIIGKPHPPMVEAVSARTGLMSRDMVMVGDRLYTDIAMGVTGVHTVLVLSGETRQEDVASSPWQPDLVVQSVNELGELVLSQI
jgi:HAD superfamily hydrolase (TIGR01457 family)